MNYRYRRKFYALVDADKRDSKLNSMSQAFESVIAQNARLNVPEYRCAPTV